MSKGGRFRLLSFPHASATYAWGVNDDAVIVGTYSSNTCLECGFAMRNGKFLSFSYPGAPTTLVFGVNNAGQVVGSYTLGDQIYHGFVSTPITAIDF